MPCIGEKGRGVVRKGEERELEGKRNMGMEVLCFGRGDDTKCMGKERIERANRGRRYGGEGRVAACTCIE